jgi:hypothetical protein
VTIYLISGHTGKATALYVPGFDPKSGNGKIARQLLQMLQVRDFCGFLLLPACGYVKRVTLLSVVSVLLCFLV